MQVSTTVFTEMRFWALVVFSVVLPCAVYLALLCKRSISRARVLFFGLALVFIAGVDVYLLQGLATAAKATPSLADNVVFVSELSVALYLLRMFAITAFYHRYFAHRAFRTSRGMQALFATIGASSVQRGPLWWAAHHRHHHRHADTPQDPHSPGQRGFLWSHAGWFLTEEAFATDRRRVQDLARYTWDVGMLVNALQAQAYARGNSVPSAAQVMSWVEQARSLPVAVYDNAFGFGDYLLALEAAA